jgi:C4-dicarboxylate-specific signal transduction histidine kinase
MKDKKIMLESLINYCPQAFVFCDLEGVPIGLSSYSRNISDIKESQKRLKEQQIMLTSTAKFSAVGEMAGCIAHEINKPLAIIKAKSDRLIRKISDNKMDNLKIISEIQDIDNTIEPITKIVQGLKLISRDSEFDPIEDVLISEVVQDTLNLCQEKFKYGGIELSVNSSLFPDTIVLGRSAQLSQVLLNILNNAYDAIYEEKEKWISISIEASDKYAFIKVKNSGPRISEDIIDKIMDPFFTTKAVGLGTGLGLSVSKRIMEKLNGDFYLEEKAKNTVFCIKTLLKVTS